jgi:hypothetical protein
MTRFQQRFFISVDEWIGGLLCIYLWRVRDPAFAYVFSFWIFCVYVISYPAYWGWWSWAWRWWRSW